MRTTMLSLLRKWIGQAGKPGGSAQAENRPMEERLSVSLATNKDVLQSVFRDSSDIVFQELRDADKPARLLLYAEGMIDEKVISIAGLTAFTSGPSEPVRPDDVPITATEATDTINGVVEAVVSGSAVVLEDGSGTATVLKATEGTRRGVQEPMTEAVIRGPKEGFTERITVNTALLRFKIKSPHLKLRSFVLGKHTRTAVVLAYMEGLADPKIVDEASGRLQQIRIDSVLESGYIEEMIEDNPLSPFPQLLYTERPDSVAAQLLEGKFAIFTDGTPFVLTGPATAFQFMQASEDYYEQSQASSLLRALRYMFLLVGLFLPALYIAVTTFHQDMLPTSLIISIAAARENIPFPALVEALIMEIAFEVLREAGIRLPKSIGQTVSILGALVIGQAAVQAGIVSAPVVIVVSLTGIASFAIPKYNFSIAVRILRFPLMLLGGLFGVFGIVIGTLWIAAHMCNLTSFGVPYLEGVAPMKWKELKDVVIRVPWWTMNRRPTESASGQNRVKSDRQFLNPEEEP